MTRDPIDFTEGQRVYARDTGEPATMRQYTNRRTGETFWKGLTDSGRRIYAEDVIANLEGAFELRCQECRIPFKSDDRTDPLCPTCDPTRAREQDEREHTAIRDHARYGAAVKASQAAARVSTPPTRRSAPTDDRPVEKHPKGCLCGQTPDCFPF